MLVVETLSPIPTQSFQTYTFAVYRNHHLTTFARKITSEPYRMGDLEEEEEEEDILPGSSSLNHPDLKFPSLLPSITVPSSKMSHAEEHRQHDSDINRNSNNMTTPRSLDTSYHRSSGSHHPVLTKKDKVEFSPSDQKQSPRRFNIDLYPGGHKQRQSSSFQSGNAFHPVTDGSSTTEHDQTIPFSKNSTGTNAKVDVGNKGKTRVSPRNDITRSSSPTQSPAKRYAQLPSTVPKSPVTSKSFLDSRTRSMAIQGDLTDDEIDAFLDLIVKYNPETMTPENMNRSVNALYDDWIAFCATRGVQPKPKKPLMDEYGKIFNGHYGMEAQKRARAIAEETARQRHAEVGPKDTIELSSPSAVTVGNGAKGDDRKEPVGPIASPFSMAAHPSPATTSMGLLIVDESRPPEIKKRKSLAEPCVDRLQRRKSDLSFSGDDQDHQSNNETGSSKGSSGIAKVGRNGLAVLPPGLFDILRTHLKDEILNTVMPMIRTDLIDQTRDLFLQNHELFSRVRALEDQVRTQDLWIRHLLSREHHNTTTTFSGNPPPTSGGAGEHRSSTANQEPTRRVTPRPPSQSRSPFEPTTYPAPLLPPSSSSFPQRPHSASSSARFHPARSEGLNAPTVGMSFSSSPSFSRPATVNQDRSIRSSRPQFFRYNSASSSSSTFLAHQPPRNQPVYSIPTDSFSRLRRNSWVNLPTPSQTAVASSSYSISVRETGMEYPGNHAPPLPRRNSHILDRQQQQQHRQGDRIPDFPYPIHRHTSFDTWKGYPVPSSTATASSNAYEYNRSSSYHSRPPPLPPPPSHPPSS